jgi:hypothetical protein
VPREPGKESGTHLLDERNGALEMCCGVRAGALAEATSVSTT